MASPSAQRATSTFFSVGHHGFVKAALGSNAAPNGSADDLLRPVSRGREPAPVKKSSTFSLNVLKKRPTQPASAKKAASSNSPSLQPDSPSTPRSPLDLSPKSGSPMRHHSSSSGGNFPPPPSHAPPSFPPPPLPQDSHDAITALPEQQQQQQQRGRSQPFSGPHASYDGDPLGDLPMPPRIPGGIHTRESSRNRSISRPGSSAGSLGTDSRPGTPSDDKKKRRNIIGGKLHKRTPSDVAAAMNSGDRAFFLGPNGRGDAYDLQPLIKGQPVPELWNPQGNLFVYLYDRAPQASFRLDASIIASSRGLQRLVSSSKRRSKLSPPPGHKMRNLSLGNAADFAASQRARSASTGSAEASWGAGVDEEPQDIEIRLPIMIDPSDPAPEEVGDLITARNMFASLIGQLIVGSPVLPTFFHIFMSVAGMMKRFEFGNFDGSTLGEAAEAAFLGYVADLRLDDVRKSREKTIEALLLGERMKCWSLYNEAYVHAVGKWKDIIDKRDPKLMGVSQRSRTAMEKSAMDLETRIASVREHLDDFQFHSLFAGFANSKATKQAVDIPAWETAWKAMRKHVLGFYKKAYGSWPPKAKSKKNEFEESGLNRLLLQEVYRDFTDLYDMMVNRNDLTERTLDATHEDNLSDDVAMDHLRKLLSEFDRGMVPVRPPIPFDIPLVPTVNSSVIRGYEQMDKTRQEAERGKKVKGDNLTSVLMNSYNRDSMKTTPFIEAFMAWERNIGHGRSINELANIRVGAWIFVYVVLQMLPLLVVDAPGLQHTRGVESFLCEVPKGSPPWMPEQKGGKVYYRVAGTGGVVSMPADLVEHGVDGIFRRSHCWVAASKWTGQDASKLLPGGNSSTQMSQAGPPASVTGSAHNYGHAHGHGSRQASISGAYPPSAHPSESTRSLSGQMGQMSMAGAGGGGLDYGDWAPPPTLTADGLLPVGGGPGGGSGPNSARGSRASLLPGLEALPMPPTLGVDGIGGPGGSRRASGYEYDPGKSFDDILSGIQGGQNEKKGKKGKK